MNDDLLMNFDTDVIRQIKLPSFMTLNSKASQISSGDSFIDNFLIYQSSDQNQKTEEDDSFVQYSLPSNSSTSTPNVAQCCHGSQTGCENFHCSFSADPACEPKINVEFASPNSFFYKDADRSSKAVKLTRLPNLEHPVLYVEKGRIVEVTVETNFYVPPKSSIRFDIFTLKGLNKEPVYGSQDTITDVIKADCNPCFIRAVEEKKLLSSYGKSETGLIYMQVPFKTNPCSFSVVFPYSNFKCSSASKKVVYLNVSAFCETRLLAEKRFQLVSCSSPNRDFKRHFEKLTGSSDTVIGKKIRVTNEMKTTESQNESVKIKTTDNPQYVIMTESYEIWKILSIIHQQLAEHFDSNKK